MSDFDLVCAKMIATTCGFHFLSPGGASMHVYVQSRTTKFIANESTRQAGNYGKL